MGEATRHRSEGHSYSSSFGLERLGATGTDSSRDFVGPRQLSHLFFHHAGSWPQFEAQRIIVQFATMVNAVNDYYLILITNGQYEKMKNNPSSGSWQIYHKHNISKLFLFAAVHAKQRWLPFHALPMNGWLYACRWSNYYPTRITYSAVEHNDKYSGSPLLAPILIVVYYSCNTIVSAYYHLFLNLLAFSG